MSNVRVEVANALYWSFAIPRDRVTADVDDGVVTLHGVVERAYERANAEAVARQVPGVTRVKNEISLGFAEGLSLPGPHH
jgi:osmotically-inducible protein OsmY